MKTAPKSIAPAIGASPREVLKIAESQAWWYLHDLEKRPEKPGGKRQKVNPDGTIEMVDIEWAYEERPPRLHFGPIAEDLEAVSPHLVTRDWMGRLMTDERDKLGIVWAAVADLDEDHSAKLDEVLRRLDALEGKRPPTVVEGEVA